MMKNRFSLRLIFSAILITTFAFTVLTLVGSGLSHANLISEESSTPLDGKFDPAMKSTVLIYLKESDGSRGALCSGVVISDKHVLTAGHCFEDGLAPEELEFSDGFLFKSTRQPVGVHRLTRKMKWQETEFRNAVDDLAIVSFAGGLPDNVEPTEFGNRPPLQGESFFIAGYGDCQIGGDGKSGTLRKLKSQIISSDEAFDLWIGWLLIKHAHTTGGIPPVRSVLEEIKEDKDGIANNIRKWLESGMLISADRYIREGTYGWLGNGDSGGPWYQEDFGKMKLVGISAVGVNLQWMGTNILPFPIFSANIFSDEARNFVRNVTGIEY